MCGTIIFDAIFGVVLSNLNFKNKATRDWNSVDFTSPRSRIKIKCKQIYPTLTAISSTPTLHLAWFMASSISKPTLILFSFPTYIFHVFVRPCFLLPFTSNSNAFCKTCPSSLLNTCPYHLTPFAFAIWTTVYFNPNVYIRSSFLFFSISFAPHIAFTIALSVFLKIAISFKKNSTKTLILLQWGWIGV